ncbi:MAG TPA: hypothetical protein VN948_18645 [Terriglobales bacterium]|nr:hypothetical protein [Terriglobales bacterium]
MAKNSPLARVVLCLAVLTLVGVTALGLGSKDGYITINGGKMTVAMSGPSKFVTPSIPHAPGLNTIYSNLGTGSTVYNCCVGWTISSKASLVGSVNWVANAFTPTADATATQLQVGVGFVTGTNETTISINPDNGGVPSKAFLKQWYPTNLPTFGTCCTLETGNDSAGIPLKAGTQYWVVVRTCKASADTWNAWNLDTSGATGPLANNTGTGWKNQGTNQQGSFGVFGK